LWPSAHWPERGGHPVDCAKIESDLLVGAEDH
jgi:hypothetical protein